MKTIGLYLILLSLISLIVTLIGIEFRIFNWMDAWGPAIGYVIRFVLIGIGISLMFVKSGNPEEKFHELKEIQELEEEKEKLKSQPDTKL